jgi:hypothetical protein
LAIDDESVGVPETLEEALEGISSIFASSVILEESTGMAVLAGRDVDVQDTRRRRSVR